MPVCDNFWHQHAWLSVCVLSGCFLTALVVGCGMCLLLLSVFSVRCSASSCVILCLSLPSLCWCYCINTTADWLTILASPVSPLTIFATHINFDFQQCADASWRLQQLQFQGRLNHKSGVPVVHYTWSVHAWLLCIIHFVHMALNGSLFLHVTEDIWQNIEC